MGLVFLLAGAVNAQSDSYWESVPKEVRERKAFKRFEWFYRQRALPDDAIPDGAIERAREVEMAKEQFRSPQEKLLDLSWTNIGPTGVVCTYPSSWGILSGRVRALAVHPTDPNTAYIGPAAGGIWKTTNGGTSWQDVGVSLASLTFGAIAIDPSSPSTVYAGAGESIQNFNWTTYNGKGLFKSTDGGGTWTQITALGSTTHFAALKVSPTNSSYVFAALGSGYWHNSSPGNEGLWQSTNAGVNWNKTLPADDGFDVLPHPTTASRVYGATGGAVSTAGFYVSTNNGGSWAKSVTGLPHYSYIYRIQIALSPASTSTIYAFIYSNTGRDSLFKSTNNGSNWTYVYSQAGTGNQGWYDLMLAVNPSNASEVYIGDSELRRSTDSGSNFSYVGSSYWNQTMHVDFHIMAFAPSNSNYRYIGCDGGIYRSTDGGSTWADRNSTLPTLQYYRLGSHPTNQNIMTGGAQDNGVYSTTNGGSGNWTLVNQGDGMECFYDYSTPTTVYVSTQSGGLNVSTTGGGYGSFNSIKPTTGDSWAWVAPFFIHPTNSSIIYTASKRPWRSTNGGSSWTDLTSGVLVTTDAINTMAQSPVTPNNMMLAASEWQTNPPVYVSTNGGTSWTNVTANIGYTAKYISRVVFHPTQGNTCFVVRSGFSSGNKIHRSTNMGASGSWANVSGDLPDVPHNDLFIDPDSINNWYTANDLGVYKTTNGGTNWTRQSNGLPYVPAIDFSYFSSGGTRLLRVGTHGRSAYQAPLSSTATIQVTSPNGGEVWRIGSSENITWTSSGISGNVKIDLSRNGGTSYETLFASTSDDGSESWTVAGASTVAALIRVSSVNNPAVRDSSNGVFWIIQPTITVLAPNGGETWTVGQLAAITWTSVNLTGNVKIELTRNGGSTYETLFASTTDDGIENWPVAGTGTTQARIRITSVAIPSVSDSSDIYFNIVQPTITVTVPNGTETWAIGTSQNIQWTSSGISGSVKIELSRDGGSSYETLYASTPDDGIEPWLVTGSATTLARVRITSVGNPSIRDVSDADFSIVQPTITVTVPNGSETWAIGTNQNIQWTWSNFTGNVMIELSRNGGSNYEMLFASTANDGSESWAVSGSVTTQGKVRITSIDIPTLSDVSDANFSIVQPTITVTYPNGGQTWAIGSSQTIYWTSSNLTGSVAIELSRNGGSSYEVLYASTPDDGSQSWTVTGSTTAQARIRITSIDIPSVSDVSDADFSIVQATITVTRPNGGETWVIGTSETINWTHSNVPGNVRIELMRDGSGIWEPLFPSTPNDGSQSWTVTAPPTAQGIIRISSVDIPSVWDVSNANFSITQASTITVVAPNGGERWYVGQSRTISWTSSGITGGVQIELSRDNGSTYGTLFANTPNDGTENWTVTSPTTTQALVRISSVTIPGISDQSNGVFVIAVADTVRAPVSALWNIVSLPVVVTDTRKDSVFRSATSSASTFGPTGYITRDTLRYGEGYWLKFAAPETLTIVGNYIQLDTIDVRAGWNMIGAISTPVAASSVIQIPSPIVISPYFGYTSTGYINSSVLQPMRGYWVKVNQDGRLVLSGVVEATDWNARWLRK